MQVICRGKLFGARLMAEGQIKWDDGYLTIMGMSGIMLPLSAFIAFQKILEGKSGKGGGGIDIYNQFKLVGVEIANAQIRVYHKHGPELLYCNWELSSFAGFGKFIVIDVNTEKASCMFNVQNSNIADTYGKSDRPSCHIMRGLAAGVSQIAFERDDMECIETACKCMGYPECSFKIKPRDEIMKDDKYPPLKQQIEG
jgi:predicted hydrocarbon binding protein